MKKETNETEHRFTPIKWLRKTINRALYFEKTRSLLVDWT